MSTTAYFGRSPETQLMNTIQMVVITHYDCKDKLNQTIISKIYDILSKNRELLSTDVPEDHIMLVESLPYLKDAIKPVELLEVTGKVKLIIDRIKNQLRFIHNQLW